MKITKIMKENHLTRYRCSCRASPPPKVWGSSIESEKYYSRQRNRLTGVPKPLTASQPAWAGKPVVPHPVADPLVISVNAAEPVE